jgi:hypothetical protein
MELQETPEGPTITSEDFLGIRDCQGPVAYVLTDDGTRRAWWGPILRGRCGHRYSPRNTLRHRSLACAKCANNPAFRFLLYFGEDVRDWGSAPRTP